MRIAQTIHSQKDLNRVLRRFTAQHHAGLIERLKPHLAFEPQPFKRGEK